jgi:hypothetical protein
METKYVIVRRSAGQGVANIPQVLTDYRRELQDVLPSIEPYISNEPRFNRAFLHSSLRSRAMLVRLKSDAGLIAFPEFQQLAVNWRPPVQPYHEISEDGLSWNTPLRAGLRLEVTYTPPGAPAETLFLGIHFSDTAQ